MKKADAQEDHCTTQGQSALTQFRMSPSRRQNQLEYANLPWWPKHWLPRRADSGFEVARLCPSKGCMVEGASQLEHLPSGLHFPALNVFLIRYFWKQGCQYLQKLLYLIQYVVLSYWIQYNPLLCHNHLPIIIAIHLQPPSSKQISEQNHH